MNFMINVLNDLPKDYNVILDGLENHVMVTEDDVLTINDRKVEKVEKEKALGAYNK